MHAGHLCRYGENVIEANANPDWVCPVCRDICNCSRCRRVKGWEPTGNLYRKVNFINLTISKIPPLNNAIMTTSSEY